MIDPGPVHDHQAAVMCRLNRDRANLREYSPDQASENAIINSKLV